MTTGPTRFVDTDQDYQRPESAASRMRDRLRRQPRVDAHGRPLPAAIDPTVAAVIGGTDPATTTNPATPPTGTSSGSHTPVPTPGTQGTVAERMRAKAQLQLDQPIPPGSTTV